MINNTWKQWRNGDKWWEKSINMMKTIMKQLQADENWWDKWWNIKNNKIQSMAQWWKLMKQMMRNKKQTCTQQWRNHKHGWEKQWSLLKAVQIQWHMMENDEKMMKHYRKQMKTMTACGRHDETNDEMWLKKTRDQNKNRMMKTGEKHDDLRWEPIQKQWQHDINWGPVTRTISKPMTNW